MNRYSIESEYNTLSDSHLITLKQKDKKQTYITNYIVDEKELELACALFEIVFTNEIAKNSKLLKHLHCNDTVSSIGIPAELVIFIKSFKTISDLKKYLDQFRLQAILHIFDAEAGNFAIRDFLYSDDILNLTDFFAKNKSKIMSFIDFQCMFRIICDENIGVSGDRVHIFDIDCLIESITPILNMLKQLFLNPLKRFDLTSSDKSLKNETEECIKKYFQADEANNSVLACSKVNFCTFLEDILEAKAPKSVVNFIDIYSLDNKSLKDYFEKNDIESFDYFMDTEKNKVFKKITGYDMNPIFSMHGSHYGCEFNFEIPVTLVEKIDYKPQYRWQKKLESKRVAEKKIDPLLKKTGQSTVAIGKQYEEHVKNELINKYGFVFEEYVGRSGDGGVDILMKDASGNKIAVQCKFISKGTVGAKAASEIHKGAALKNADFGMICSNTSFSKQCQIECSSLNIRLEIIGMTKTEN